MDAAGPMEKSGRRILLAVGGGIAAYKAAETVRRLQDRGFTVQVAMTAAAREFITPLTFAALTREKVVTDLFTPGRPEQALDSAIEHIEVPKRADLLLVAPATADLLAKLAHGLADDFVTTAYLAFTGPVAVAPAMNVNMWDHPATQENVRRLQERGLHFIEPDAGALACGMVGPGRLAEPDAIAARVEEILLAEAPARDLADRTVLITAGPTREPLDPVRYLSNRSSGRMGLALAAEAAARGAKVELVLGPTALEPPAGVELTRVETAEQMYRAALDRWPRADVAILAAAVADFRPARPAESKWKKSDGVPGVELEPTPDILAALGQDKVGRILVGFAAETDDLERHAAEKLFRKNCDFLVANPVGEAAGGTGFDADENQGVQFSATDEPLPLPRSSKREMARRIFEAIAPRVREKQVAG